MNSPSPSPNISPRKPGDVTALALDKGHRGASAETKSTVQKAVKVEELTVVVANTDDVQVIISNKKIVVIEPAKVAAPVTSDNIAKKANNSSSSSYSSGSSDDDSCFKIAAQPARDEPIRPFVGGENAATTAALGIVSFVAVAAVLFL